MTTIQKQMQLPSKEQLLRACIAKQRALIADFNRGIRELDGGGSTEYGADQPGLVEEVALRHRQLTDQLLFAREELKVLEGMHLWLEERYDEVQLGSVVATDKGLFYISVSIERFEVDGTPFIGISPQSPLYRAMAGKKKGDSFAFGTEVYQILEIC
ncbi:hypothetical protein GCM10011386_26590 [Parapedobacter defluvii]|uniref:Uncharacterized protein n=1 Tax=Parapedobacter defluvii TaxID=2045106 RepID=A0ABQ1M1L6_9SPHI|nr:hypothetical protein [Parapedobacter defluvii]GGC33197.1 hypothetical protein GCM10011386_26590 [Parapedobacter defluvii]